MLITIYTDGRNSPKQILEIWSAIHFFLSLDQSKFKHEEIGQLFRITVC
jgi:hypothetical protein